MSVHSALISSPGSAPVSSGIAVLGRRPSPHRRPVVASAGAAGKGRSPASCVEPADWTVAAGISAGGHCASASFAPASAGSNPSGLR